MNLVGVVFLFRYDLHSNDTEIGFFCVYIFTIVIVTTFCSDFQVRAATFVS